MLLNAHYRLGIRAALTPTSCSKRFGIQPTPAPHQPHIWAAGDVIGRQHGSQMATPGGARQGRIVAENALADARRRFDGAVIPRAIFTDPPIAVVGLTEAEVKAKHLPAVSATTPFEYVPRAGAIHKPMGLVKFIASTIDERVVGVHVVGESAPEIIHEAAMAMKLKATLTDFIDLIHVYPTMAEAGRSAPPAMGAVPADPVLICTTFLQIGSVDIDVARRAPYG